MHFTIIKYIRSNTIKNLKKKKNSSPEIKDPEYLIILGINQFIINYYTNCYVTTLNIHTTKIPPIQYSPGILWDIIEIAIDNINQKKFIIGLSHTRFNPIDTFYHFK